MTFEKIYLNSRDYEYRLKLPKIGEIDSKPLAYVGKLRHR